MRVRGEGGRGCHSARGRAGAGGGEGGRLGKRRARRPARGEVRGANAARARARLHPAAPRTDRWKARGMEGGKGQPHERHRRALRARALRARARPALLLAAVFALLLRAAAPAAAAGAAHARRNVLDVQARRDKSGPSKLFDRVVGAVFGERHADAPSLPPPSPPPPPPPTPPPAAEDGAPTKSSKGGFSAMLHRLKDGISPHGRTSKPSDTSGQVETGAGEATGPPPPPPAEARTVDEEAARSGSIGQKAISGLRTEFKGVGGELDPSGAETVFEAAASAANASNVASQKAAAEAEGEAAAEASVDEEERTPKYAGIIGDIEALMPSSKTAASPKTTKEDAGEAGSKARASMPAAACDPAGSNSTDCGPDQENMQTETMVRVAESDKIDASGLVHAAVDAVNAVTGAKVSERDEKEAVQSLGGSAKDGAPAGGKGATGVVVDGKGNVYTLSRPAGGALELHSDSVLLRGLTAVAVAAMIAALLSSVLRLSSPAALYLVAGACVGPGGVAIVEQLVQVETVVQLGVVGLLFCLGADFSPARLGAVKGVALGGAVLQVVGITVLGGASAYAIGLPPAQGASFGLLMSMSSTSVVSVGLELPSGALPRRAGTVVVGILVGQDMLVGICAAAAPLLGQRHAGAGGASLAAGVLVCLLLAFAAVTLALGRFVFPRLVAPATSPAETTRNRVVVFGLAMGIACTAEWLGLSLELGAYMAGAAASASTPAVAALAEDAMRPIMDCFQALFLTAVGMCMPPRFLASHALLLTIATLVVTIVKAIIVALTTLAWREPLPVAVCAAGALAHAGEFSFVLLGKLSDAGALPREMFLLGLGICGLSLLSSPAIVWLAPRLAALVSAPGAWSSRAASQVDEEYGSAKALKHEKGGV